MRTFVALVLFFIASNAWSHSSREAVCAGYLHLAKPKLSEPAQAYVRLISAALNTHILDFSSEGNFMRLLNSNKPFNPFSLSSTEPTEIVLAQAVEPKLATLQSEWDQIKSNLTETGQSARAQGEEVANVISQTSWVMGFADVTVLSLNSEIIGTTAWQVIDGRVFSAAISRPNVLHILELDTSSGKVFEVERKSLRDQARSLSWHVTSNIAYIAIAESDAHIHIYEFRVRGESLELKYPSRKRVGLINSRASWKAIGNRLFIAFGAETRAFVFELDRSHELKIIGKLEVDGTANFSPSWHIEGEKVFIAFVVYKSEEGSRFYIFDLNLSAPNNHQMTVINDSERIMGLTVTSAQWQKLGERLFLVAGWSGLHVLEYVVSENKIIKLKEDTGSKVHFAPQWQVAGGRAFIAMQSFDEGIHVFTMDPERGLIKLDQAKMRSRSSFPASSWVEIEGRFYLAAIGNDSGLYVYELDAQSGKLNELSEYRTQASIQTEPRWYTAEDGSVFVSVADIRGGVHSFYFKSRLKRAGKGE